MAALVHFALRHWNLLLGGLLLLGLVALLGIRTVQRDTARAALTASQAQVASLQAHVARQNEGIGRLRHEGEARRRAGEAALAEARRANRRQQPFVARLRENAARPPAADAPCTIGDALRQAEGL